jgi:hypothetical protein
MEYDRFVFRGPKPCIKLGEPVDYVPDIIPKSIDKVDNKGENS